MYMYVCICYMYVMCMYVCMYEYVCIMCRVVWFGCLTLKMIVWHMNIEGYIVVR